MPYVYRSNRTTPSETPDTATNGVKGLLWRRGGALEPFDILPR